MSFRSKIILIAAILCSCGKPVQLDESRWWTIEDQQYIIDELTRTTGEIDDEVSFLSSQQWNFRESPDRWTIGEIIEHLEMQNQLHYREITIGVNFPQIPDYRTITEGQDDYFRKYANDTIKGIAQWYLQPKGKFCSKEAGLQSFFTARNELTNFVKQTEIDLRRQFTFRVPANSKTIGNMVIGEVRDLHQLLLTGIAHTDRHLNQIRQIKRHPDFPE